MICFQEETKAKQRSRDKAVKEGERNTTHFHAAANQTRKTYIQSLDGASGLVTQTKDLLNVVSDFYKDLFKFEERHGFRLIEDFFSKEDKMQISKNETLESPFSEEEVKKVAFDSYPDRAPGHDGIPFFFYQH